MTSAMWLGLLELRLLELALHMWMDPVQVHGRSSLEAGGSENTTSDEAVAEQCGVDSPPCDSLGYDHDPCGYGSVPRPSWLRARARGGGGGGGDAGTASHALLIPCQHRLQAVKTREKTRGRGSKFEGGDCKGGGVMPLLEVDRERGRGR